MDNKTVLITGCSSGIGKATARAFLDDEWQVFATARNPADIETLGEAGADISTLDVTEDDDVERVVSRIVEEEGRIDALVNNAGYGQHGPLEDVPVERLHAQFDVNVYGPHRLTRAVLPHMREREDGTIVNVSSLSAHVAVPGMGAYAGSKAALERMSDALRTEVDGFGVDIVIVEPGPVRTPFRERVDDELDRYDRTEAYADIYQFQEDASLFGADSPVADPPEVVAETILEAAVSPDPDPRYVVGEFGKYAAMLRYVPDRWRDSAFRLVRKLTS